MRRECHYDEVLIGSGTVMKRYRPDEDHSYGVLSVKIVYVERPKPDRRVPFHRGAPLIEHQPEWVSNVKPESTIFWPEPCTRPADERYVEDNYSQSSEDDTNDNDHSHDNDESHPPTPPSRIKRSRAAAMSSGSTRDSDEAESDLERRRKHRRQAGKQRKPVRKIGNGEDNDSSSSDEQEPVRKPKAKKAKLQHMIELMRKKLQSVEKKTEEQNHRENIVPRKSPDLLASITMGEHVGQPAQRSSLLEQATTSHADPILTLKQQMREIQLRFDTERTTLRQEIEEHKGAADKLFVELGTAKEAAQVQITSLKEQHRREEEELNRSIQQVTEAATIAKESNIALSAELQQVKSELELLWERIGSTLERCRSRRHEL